MTAIRPIVKAAFKIDEMVEQFVNIDVPDKYLEHGTPEEVSGKYDDAYLVGEARNRLDLVLDQLDCLGTWDDEDRKTLKRDERQLRNFIKRWSK
mgnify:CR=1 FL=1|tara:strand:- start:174 stop:455 length:282 start_codon:yes stop_codon:yes gene_type:complete